MSNSPDYLLIIEDDDSHLQLLIRSFEKSSLTMAIKSAGNLTDARKIISQYPPLIILADLNLPDGSGEELLGNSNLVNIPIIIMTGVGNENIAVDLMKKGIADYIVKSENSFSEIPSRVRRCLRDWYRLAEQKRIQQELEDSENHLSSIISSALDGFITISSNGVIQYCNPSACQLLKYNEKELIGRDLTDIIPERYLNPENSKAEYSVQSYLKSIENDIIGKTVEMHTVAKDSSEIPIELSVVKWKYQDNYFFTGIMRDISQRILDRTRIFKSEKRFRKLYDSNLFGIAFFKKDGLVMDANSLFLDKLGLSTLELENQEINWRELTPEEYNYLDQKGLQQAVENGYCEPYEKEYYTQDGNRIWVLCGFSILNEDDLFGITFLFDISDAKDIAERKKSSDSLYRTLVEASPNGVITTDSQGIISYCNNRVEEYLGYTGGTDLIRHGIKKIIITEFYPEFKDRMNKSMISQLPQSFSSYLITKSGKGLPVRINIAALSNENNKSSGNLIIFSDMTEEEEIKYNLIRSEETLKEAQNIALMGSFSTDSRISKMYWSDGLYDIFNLSINDFKPTIENFLSLVDSSDRKELEEYLNKILTDDISISFEFAGNLDDVKTKYFQITARPDYDDANELNGIVGVVQDISDRKEADLLNSALYKISQIAISTIQLSDCLEKIHRIISELLDAQNFYIAIYDYESDLLTFPYFIDQYEDNITPHVPANGLTEFVITRGETLLIDDKDLQKMVVSKLVSFSGEPMKSWLGVPLKSKSITFGAIVVQNYNDRDAYSNREREILEFVSGQVSLTIVRKQTEDALIDREKRLRLLFENTHDLIVITNDKAEVTWSNPAWNNIFGNNTDDQRNPFSPTHPDDLDKVTQAWEEMVKYQVGMSNLEYRLWTPMEQYSTFEASSYPVRFKDKLHFYIILHDISKRKQAEFRYESIFQSVNIGLYQSSVDGKFTTANPELARIMGYRNVQDLLDSQIDLNTHFYVDYQKRERILEKLKIQGSISNLESEIYRKDGSRIWISENFKKLIDETGKFIGIEGTISDISERKLVEHSLEESEVSYRSLYHNATDAIYILDLNGRILDVNEGTEKLLGHDKDFFIGKLFKDIGVPTKNDMSVIMGHLSATKKGDPQSFEFWGRKSDGIIFPMMVRLSKGIFIGEDVIFAFTLDITESKQDEMVKTAVYQISQTVNSESTITRTLESINIIISDLMSAKNMYVALIDLQNHTVEVLYGVDQFDDFKSYKQPGKGLSTYVYKMGEPMLIDHQSYQDLVSSGKIDIIGKPPKCWIGAPLVLKDRPIGIIALQDYEFEDTYTKNDLNILTFLSSQIAITIERKRVQDQLKDSFEILHEAQEIANLGSFSFNFQTGFWESSEILNRIFGIDDSYHCNYESWFSLIFPADRDAVRTHLEKDVKINNQLFNKSYRIVKNDTAEMRWVHCRGRIKYDNDGNIFGMFGTLMDITREKIAEEELKEKMKQISRANKFMVNREKKMMDLKREVNSLRIDLGLSIKYDSVK